MTFLRASRAWDGGVFGKFPLHERLKKQSQGLKDAVERHDADDLLNGSVDDLTEAFVRQFDLEPPVIHWDDAEQLPPEETRIEAPSDVWSIDRGPARTTRLVAGTRQVITIPLSGAIELLGATGSTSLVRTWERTTVQDSELVIWNEWINATPEVVSAWWTRERSEIERQVNPMVSDLAPWRERLPETARNLVAQRRERLLKNRGLEGVIGLPVRRRDHPPRPVPVHRKRVATTRTLRRPSRPSFMPEPALTDDIYNEVIDIICSFGRSLERSPRVSQRWTEEELRDQLLIQLNGHYVGEAGGELFNGAGRTDIIVRHEDRNVFVGECKYWGGQKRFVEAVDQLNGYLVWRDTKAAIILFIKQKDPTLAIEKALAALRGHRQYKRTGKASPESESYTNHVLRHGDDDQREVHLALIPIVVRPTQPTPHASAPTPTHE